VIVETMLHLAVMDSEIEFMVEHEALKGVVEGVKGLDYRDQLVIMGGGSGYGFRRWYGIRRIPLIMKRYIGEIEMKNLWFALSLLASFGLGVVVPYGNISMAEGTTSEDSETASEDIAVGTACEEVGTTGEIEDPDESVPMGGMENEDIAVGTALYVDELESGLGYPIREEDFVQFTSAYGRRISPVLQVQVDHVGLDIQAVWRAQVVAVADGVVVEHWPPPDGYFKGHRVYGGMVRVDHGYYETVYAHLHSTEVYTGQHLKKGEFIGRVGGTGYTVGEHLHFEVRVNGAPVNPLLYIPSYGNISIGEELR